MSRRAGREMALRALYQVDLVGIESEAALVSVKGEYPETVRSFARELLAGTLSHLQEIDEILESAAREWRVQRMPTTDRNILRIAAYEVLFAQDIPVGAAINEAVELAKKYGTDGSGRFVNGVLANLAQRKENPGPVSN